MTLKEFIGGSMDNTTFTSSPDIISFFSRIYIFTKKVPKDLSIFLTILLILEEYFLPQTIELQLGHLLLIKSK